MATGTVATANIMTVAITCSINSFTVGGMVSGLTGTVVLRNNGGNDRSITANGPYTFTTSIASGMIYAVTVFSNPANQTCSITNGGGTVTGANITNANATCVTAGTDPGILCSPGTYCSTSTQFCCFNRDLGQGTCQATGTTCTTQPMTCDDAADCGGGPRRT